MEEGGERHGDEEEEQREGEVAQASPAVYEMDVGGGDQIDSGAEPHDEGGHHAESGVIDLNDEEERAAEQAEDEERPTYLEDGLWTTRPLVPKQKDAQEQNDPAELKIRFIRPEPLNPRDEPGEGQPHGREREQDFPRISALP